MFLAQSTHKGFFFAKEKTVHDVVFDWSGHDSGVEAIDALSSLLFKELSLRKLFGSHLGVGLAKFRFPLCFGEQDLLFAHSGFFAFLFVIFPHSHQLLPDAFY